jgi:membrane protein DedA with SNARE-associated domain
MSDAIMDYVEGAMGSPWVYVALLAFAMIDGFFPAVPSESLVVSAGVFAASGEPNLVAIIAAAALGAFAGDHISYLIGRTAGRRALRRGQPAGRMARALERGRDLLEERGGTILIVCRYIPGARTAITLTAGAVAYPLRSFSLFDGMAALSWATYSAMIGYVGGAAFEHDPFKGLALGLGLALTVALVIEVVRHLRRRAVPCTP